MEIASIASVLAIQLQIVFRKYVLEIPFVLHLFFMLSVLYYSFFSQ